jgi:predicted outer membrane protein
MIRVDTVAPKRGTSATMRAIVTAFAALLLATAVGASAGPLVNDPDLPAGPSDDEFVVAVLQEARGQIAFAEFAQSRAHAPAVRGLAVTTDAEWRALAARLEAVAAARNVTPPAGLDRAQQRILRELAQSAPDDFDAAYVRVAETDYARAAAAFRSEPASRDPAIAAAIEPSREAFDRLDRRTNDDPALPGTH